MAKAALLDVLRQTIGKYVKDVDPENLSVAIWSGKIELNSLELDVDSINSMLDKKAEEAPNLAMPFKVISGNFESFEVDVPWNKLSSSPVTLRARGLSVMIEPLDRSSLEQVDDEDATEHHMIRNMKRAAKQKELRENQIEEANTYRLQAYALKKVALAADTDHSSKENEGENSTFAQRLATRIGENIQIEITDVHVSLRNSDGSAGIVLDSLKLMTSDSAGNFVYIDRTAGSSSSLPGVDLAFLYKMLRIQGLGVYLDQDEFVNAKKSLQSISEEVTSESTNSDSVYSRRSLGHSYILAPLSFETRLRIADNASDGAKYELRSNLSVLSFLLTRNQVDIVRKVAKIMSPSNLGPSPLFPEYRPLGLVQGNAKEWWRYAARCIGRMSGRRLWPEFFRAYQKRKKYIPLFKRHRHYKDCPWVKPLNKDELCQLVSIEQDRSISVEGLMTWRNIADAQIDKEREKRVITKQKQESTTSYFSYIFGSSTPTATETEEMEVVEEPPIVLSVAEMKELEGISTLDIYDNDAAKDSIYCDIKFVLDAMKIDLVGYDFNQVALLDMGKVAFDFKACMDGAFTTVFDLYDLEVFDRTTPNSIFTSVLKQVESGRASDDCGALHLDLAKSATGDQTLGLKMVGFQLVASKLLMQEIQQFFQEASDEAVPMKMKSNPVLRKSVSGSVDLFYDAREGESFRSIPAIDVVEPETEFRYESGPEVKEILSNKLIDVWKKKSNSKITWELNVDVKAPIVLIPESCNDPEANVMVFDLGNLKVKYGKDDPTKPLQQWFDEFPRESLVEEKFETGYFDINDLTCSVQKARFWNESRVETIHAPAIIDPIRLLIDFAIEDIGPEFKPRSCFLGVIPTISMQLSPMQCSQILGVVDSWSAMFDSEESQYEMVATPKVTQSKPPPQPEHETSFPTEEQEAIDEETCAMIFCRIGLQRLRLTVFDDEKKQLEANLVSVYASVSQFSDESSVARLTMGWFWILDWMSGDYERKQRLLVHSNLPRSAESFAENREYNVIEELTKQGVFERDYSGSRELADVSFTTLPPNATRSRFNITEMLGNSDLHISSTSIRFVLDVKFRSLVVHWNPHAIKEVNAVSDQFLAILGDSYSGEESGALIVSSRKSQTSSGAMAHISIDHEEGVSESDPVLIMAEMESLGIILNSARDDLPLFTATVCGTRVSVVPRGEGQEISLSLGDIRVATPEKSGKTLPLYRTLLGLENGSFGSLLTIKYCTGSAAIGTLDLDLTSMENLEAVADIELSPMRFCYIQSQVLALSNYITDGVLGAITAQAALSAAEAAKELGNAISGNSFYSIRATSFEAIIPTAAYREDHMRLKTASLTVEYFMFSDARGSQVKVALSDLMITSCREQELQEAPICVAIDVKMPLLGVGSLDDQAMRAFAEISDAKFVLTKDQYTQIMDTLSSNIGETALFLREDELSGQVARSKETHAGVQVDESTQRIYFSLDLKEVSLVLADQGTQAPIVRLTAIDTTVSMDMIPDAEKFAVRVLLQNLVCEDCRLVALQRQCRYLIDQSEQIGESDRMDIFQIQYTQEGNTSSIALTVGSPQIVLIPDLISEVLDFVAIEESAGPTSSKDPLSQEQTINFEGGGTTNLVDSEPDLKALSTSTKSYTSKMSAKTGTCRIVLALMDFDDHSVNDNANLGDTNSGIQATETVVLQGEFAASIEMESNLDSGETIASDFQLNSEAMEIFTAFGREMKSPVQILEPASASVHGSMKTTECGDAEIEIRAAALTSIDFSLSIHNAALLKAIIDSVHHTLVEEAEIESYDEVPTSLTPKEQERIQKLASALEKTEGTDSFIFNDMASLSSSRASSSRLLGEDNTPSSTKVQIKLTMPQATITFINDLQGMDEALFRISVEKFVAGGNLISPSTIFDFHCNTSILADYFDSSVNIWSRLLVKPWEMTIKADRAPSHRSKTHRLSTTFDLESFPCWISFSEQFLVSLASASRMWTIYSAATDGSLDHELEGPEAGTQSRRTSSAARSLDIITSFPNAISNHSGMDVSFSLESGSIKDCTCRAQHTQYFRIDPPKGAGFGGTRVYGQDVEVPKRVKIIAEDTDIVVDMDLDLGLSSRAHKIGQNLTLFTRVVREGKTTILHLTSHVEISNQTLLPFSIDFFHDATAKEVGICHQKNFRANNSTTLSPNDGIVSRSTKNFSIPVPLLDHFQKEWEKYGQTKLHIRLSPLHDNNVPKLVGEASILVSLQEMRRAPLGSMKYKVEVTCRCTSHVKGVHPLTLNVMFSMKLVDGDNIVVEISLEPRSVIQNLIPLAMKVRTPMPQTFSTCRREVNEDETETIYFLNPTERVEVFTPGPSIAITTCIKDNPIAGRNLGWLDGGWVDLPLVPEFRLQDPIHSMLPLQAGKFDSTENYDLTNDTGAEIFIVEGNNSLKNLGHTSSRKDTSVVPNTPYRSGTPKPKINQTMEPSLFSLTVCNYGVDHTGSILFEQVSETEGMSSMWQSNASLTLNDSQRGRLSMDFEKSSKSLNFSQSRGLGRIYGKPQFPFGAFSSPIQRRRVTLLPGSQHPIRLLQMTMEGRDGFRRTLPFMIEQLPIGDGGASTLPIVWETKEQTGLFAYRSLASEHQSEIHIIPEFIVFNGSDDAILIKEKAMPEVIIEAGETGQLRGMARPDGLNISITFTEFECHTSPLPVAKLGLKVAMVQSKRGVAVGSVYVQTVIDTRGDARLVIKVGRVKFGSNRSPVMSKKGLFDGDFCRFRIRWTELQLILNEIGQGPRDSWKIKAARHSQTTSPTVNLHAKSSRNIPSSEKHGRRGSTMNIFKHEPQIQLQSRRNQIMKQPIMALIFSRFTVDFQRVFKDEDRSRRWLSEDTSPQRSQISVIVHNIEIKDLTPNSHYPMVFDSTSDLNVIDLCIRIRGPLSADLVKVDLFDLNLAHSKGRSEKMTLTTSEDYLWRILDLVNRILAASGEVSGFTLKYENDENDNYVIKIEDAGPGVKRHPKTLEKNQYTAPTADILYDVALTRVSPFTVVVSFRRSPDLARYPKPNGAPGAAVTNYFTRKLKFTIDKAELNFTRYEDRTLKGPSESLIEALSTVYVSRMKFKVVSLLSAASLQDWRFLAARDDGDDEYVEGDILRATGNLAGKSAGLVFRTLGRGVGGGLIRASSFIGNGIESGTSKIGARRFGTGVNSVVTGVGHGVGNTVSGVGTGANKFLQGAGQGVGHVFGGVSGGALQIGKGLSKGITTGDGKAVVEGLSKGASSIGGGLAQGAESAVMGTADGILTAGKGIFSGFKSVSHGIGGAITGKKPSQFHRKNKKEERK